MGTQHAITKARVATHICSEFAFEKSNMMIFRLALSKIKNYEREDEVICPCFCKCLLALTERQGQAF